jgi:hypothetical protein
MTMRTALSGAMFLACLPITVATAQDVPGIEICTAEKTWQRRTGCLQTNSDYLKDALTKAGLEAERRNAAAARRLEAAEREIAALKADIATLRVSLDQLKAAAPAKQPAAK